MLAFARHVPDKDLVRARHQLARVEAQAHEVIKILTAEQALKAQRVVKEAGSR